ncbi:prepilin peptidase-dependent protein [Kluyvera intermedia]|uniref:prepilin peptidase-dependent protein n=1 Tax=Kluyvera intermedia TaxID=61648 RepID=UPI00242F3630|nr:prepilin peptidase-dependent protein [Kluyvera intermedia]WEJ84316.1 MAG: prepilin peptidase-dependent protein [Kluyvera intermedia]
MLMRGFSLLETLIAMAISSILLLGASRFLPSLQFGIMQQMRQQTLEDDLWQQLFTVAKHLQRAGYCAGDSCHGEPLYLAPKGDCLIVRWDGNSNGQWETSPADEADSIGFRLKSGALETHRGATTCEGKGWDKMSEPAAMTVIGFQVLQTAHSGFPPEFAIVLSASTGRGETAKAQYGVTGYNL